MIAEKYECTRSDTYVIASGMKWSAAISFNRRNLIMTYYDFSVKNTKFLLGKENLAIWKFHGILYPTKVLYLNKVI